MATNQQAELLVKMTRTAWDAQNKYLMQFLESVDNQKLHNEIAPGKNTGAYLLGHLIAVSDAMLPLLGIGDKLYPDMEEPFIKSPDKSGHNFPPVTELRQRLDVVNAALNMAFDKMNADEWLGRHMAVSPEDFTKEPHRNKMNVLISRTNHMANHIGQLLLLK
ncbi:MAG: DinB family protein [Bacteroidetes bacterium]|nr:DinB family protein [Bacteroidota bacterium]